MFRFMFDYFLIKLLLVINIKCFVKNMINDISYLILFDVLIIGLCNKIFVSWRFISLYIIYF